jgi:5-hydroxyisourate hydrolase-like protein (transthyretin family)
MTSKLAEQKGKPSTSKKVTALHANKGATKTVTKSKLNTNSKVKKKLAAGTLMPDERRQMIAEAAYFRAEQRGFDPEQQEQDWLEAELMVDAVLNEPASKFSDVSH